MYDVRNYFEMPKRDPSWRQMAGTSKVSRSTNFSPRGGGGPKFNKASELGSWAHVWEAQDIQDDTDSSCSKRMSRAMLGPVLRATPSYLTSTGRSCVSLTSHGGNGITHRVGKRFCVKSVYILGKIWMDENIKLKNHTNSVMFWLVRDRRPYGTPMDFGQVFNMFDNEPSTATVKNDLRDRYQVMHKFYAKVTGGQYASNEQALVKRFWKVNNHVVYNHQEGWQVSESHGECFVTVIWHVLMPLTLCMQRLRFGSTSTIR
ncbi:coat protein [Sida micrantha mosaic virus-[snap bean:Brazil:2003]]|nr:coat protein [Sida micrantha mosaic virus-[snap bean:Brazil:2003]]